MDIPTKEEAIRELYNYFIFYYYYIYSEIWKKLNISGFPKKKNYL